MGRRLSFTDRLNKDTNIKTLQKMILDLLVDTFCSWTQHQDFSSDLGNAFFVSGNRLLGTKHSVSVV